MRFDPTRRLGRVLPGGSLSDDARGFERLFDREVEEERRELVPPRDQASPRLVVARNTTRVAECRPNAPLLMRIVRFPFRLDPVRPTRQTYMDEPVKFDRVDWSAEVAAALAERARLRFTSAGRSRPLPFAVRPSLWNLMPADPSSSSPGDKR